MDPNNQLPENVPPAYSKQLEQISAKSSNYFFSLPSIRLTPFITGLASGFTRDFLKYSMPYCSNTIENYFQYFMTFSRGLIQKENPFHSNYWTKYAISIMSNCFGMAAEWVLAFVITQHQLGYKCIQQTHNNLVCEDPRDFFNAQSIALLLLAANILSTVICRQAFIYFYKFEAENTLKEELYNCTTNKIGSNYNMILAILTHNSSIQAFESYLDNGVDLLNSFSLLLRSNLTEIMNNLLDITIISHTINSLQFVTNTLWYTIENARETAINRLDSF